MLIESYEFLKDLTNEFKLPPTKRHSITLNDKNRVCVGVWYNLKSYIFTLEYDEFKNYTRKDLIDYIKDTFCKMEETNVR